MEDSMNLKGKVALITGGGTGIGEAVARRFVAEGAKVCIAGRRKEMLEKVAATFPTESVQICSGDQTKPEDVKRMVAAAAEFGGRLDTVVNNAGVDQQPADLTQMSLDAWNTIMAVNLTGPFLVMKEAVPLISAEGGGAVINVASLAGLRAIPNMPGYCASKGGLVHLTRQAALDFGPAGVRCNVICPGAIRTAMLEEMMRFYAEKSQTDLDDVFTRFSKDVPVRRTAMPEEIGGLCTYLSSDDARFMTGAVITLDGGAAVVDICGAALTQLDADIS